MIRSSYDLDAKFVIVKCPFCDLQPKDTICKVCGHRTDKDGYNNNPLSLDKLLDAMFKAITDLGKR